MENPLDQNAKVNFQPPPQDCSGASSLEWPVQDNLVSLQKMRDEAKGGGGPVRVEQQHARGKLTARERVNLLLDEGSFE